MHQDDQDARGAGSEYYFGPDLLVAPVLSAVTQRSVYLPEGSWIDYWSGKTFAGRQTVSVDAPLDRIPLFVREGAIVPKIPDDVMTLVPQADFKDAAVKGLDIRRVYDLYAGRAALKLTDFEDRQLNYDAAKHSLVIAGATAQVTIRWRFAHPSAITVNGRKIERVAATQDGTVVEFAHKGTTTINWR
jgi:alpha-D-xyloside xylohydrolase